MNRKLKDRHLLGAGAAACVICCAPPLLALLGIAGAGLAATLATAVFAGLTFAAVVLAATLLGVWARRRSQGTEASCVEEGPVDVGITVASRDPR
ncbi:hypothetical protein [Nocardioides sp. TF02-7]|uniref:hypothetical protein n=1 Tax=Nocardioides sp. TF02-7 TaxID=2917724 RepID=UPI001F05C4CD|nr:hypothetical protein [Nocardioides sp. TF02-7]UMG92226.1 hypothetical protein MF408_20295 [Nocardioides sp. TF02-7]